MISPRFQFSGKCDNQDLAAVDCDARGEYVWLVREFFKPLVIVAIMVALAAYALDCGAITTTELAMQCCNSMPCAPQGHNAQDCCKSMPSMHAPFVQPSPIQSTTHALAAIATLTASGAGWTAARRDRGVRNFVARSAVS